MARWLAASWELENEHAETAEMASAAVKSFIFSQNLISWMNFKTKKADIYTKPLVCSRAPDQRY